MKENATPKKVFYTYCNNVGLTKDQLIDEVDWDFFSNDEECLTRPHLVHHVRFNIYPSTVLAHPLSNNTINNDKPSAFLIGSHDPNHPDLTPNFLDDIPAQGDGVPSAPPPLIDDHDLPPSMLGSNEVPAHHPAPATTLIALNSGSTTPPNHTVMTLSIHHHRTLHLWAHSLILEPPLVWRTSTTSLIFNLV